MSYRGKRSYEACAGVAEGVAVRGKLRAASPGLTVQAETVGVFFAGDKQAAWGHNMTIGALSLCSVSWIDEKSLPKVGFWLVAGALVSWPKRVIMGLAGTANPEPPMEITDVAAFRSRQQFRALMSCKVSRHPSVAVSNAVIDAGYTPPFDKGKLHTSLAGLAPIPEDPMFYAGQSSVISSIVSGKLHPCSTFSLRGGDHVLVGAFIKFRAGLHTDAIGVSEAKSPVHVPWVWCEYALVGDGAKVRLLMQGSKFPSHAWYVAGKQVAKRYQSPVSVSERDPAISTGQPADLPPLSADSDKSSGPAPSHTHTLDKGAMLEVDVTRFFS